MKRTITTLLALVVLLASPLSSSPVKASPGNLVNPGFESGTLAGWATGTVVDFAGVVAADGFAIPFEGTYMARLGSPLLFPRQTQPPGDNIIYQDFTVIEPTLSFAYNIFTYDAFPFNHFHYRVTDLTTGSTIAFYSQEAWPILAGELHSTGWQQVSVDLSGYLGHLVRLEIDAAGTVDDLFGTWVYVDAVTQAGDTTAPVIVIASPGDGSTYLLNQVVLADWSATDADSGIASAAGTTASGTAIDTASVGTKSFSVVATDNAGNQATQTVTYYVNYAFGGILQPINPDGSSIFKLGSTVPVKFQLQDGGGNFVPSASASLHLTKISDGVLGEEIEAVSTSAATEGNLFRYDSLTNQYIFNLGTKNLSSGTWQLRIALDDGTSKYVLISLK